MSACLSAQRVVVAGITIFVVVFTAFSVSPENFMAVHDGRHDIGEAVLEVEEMAVVVLMAAAAQAACQGGQIAS